MSRVRLRLEFDLEILDDTMALAIARSHWVDRIDDATLDGDDIVYTVPGTPADAIDRVLESPKAVTSSVAAEMLRRGGGSLSSVASFTNFTIKHI